MNDFTKEELEELKGYISLAEYLCKDVPQDCDLSLLKNKIQSRIDNYCQHEYVLWGGNGIVFTKCRICGHINKAEPYDPDLAQKIKDKYDKIYANCEHEWIHINAGHPNATGKAMKCNKCEKPEWREIQNE